MCIMVGGVGYSAPISNTMMPLAEQKVSGSRETAMTSACRLTTQKPGESFRPPGPPPGAGHRGGNGSPA